MGLWISKKIVELHGGSIVARSEGVGLGSSFEVELSLVSECPKSVLQGNSIGGIESSYVELGVVAKGSSSSGTLSEMVRVPSSQRSLLRPKVASRVSPYELQPIFTIRFLLVDDSALTRKMVNRVLVSRGHICSEAEDGLDAVEKYQAAAGAFDVIVMDNFMPRCTGPDATRKLRELGYRGLVIGATGNCLPEEVQAFMEAGVNRVMNKPVAADDLLATIEELRATSFKTGQQWLY
jgi:CheY-like chemotaxis protein